MDERESDPLPDGTNVYGTVVARSGMPSVLQAVQRFVGEEHAFIKNSGFSGASTLYFSTVQCDFESTPLEDGVQHLLSGCVAGSFERVAGFVSSLSHHLSAAGIEHGFEIYDESDNLAMKIPQ